MEKFLSDLLELININSNEWNYILRILLSCVCGGIIGIERTLRQKDAGLRTHVIVALGASLIIIISKYGFLDILEYEGLRADASRIASNIVTGISFLGAGMIFVKGSNIKGLTTAAGVWATAAVGMAIGSGLYITGILSTALIIIIQIIFHVFLVGSDKIIAHDSTFEIVVRIKNTPTALDKLKSLLKESNLVVTDTKIVLGDDGFFTITFSIAGDTKIDAPRAIEIFNSEEEIKAITF